ncbi:interleukin-12 subunit alpha [Boleophthalmus pectinirostris]|uniref:interleukin-12 subunit alpha n=1 Tax=Boleophthalmus pectinirostris TaxID=150288 RepID=UPI000A1C29B6|nr:interleukin-12 subunit alpha [Boleophthalmus pectinirostris]
MANLHIYFTGCLLLLMRNYRISVAHPVRTDGTRDSDQCATLFRSLLLDVSGLLKNDVLWHGVISDRIHPTNFSDTVLACAPEPLKESTMCRTQRSGSFNKNECWKNIVKDLTHYEAMISSYIKLENLRRPQEEVPPLEKTVQIIQNLLKSCPCTSTKDASVEEDVSRLWTRDSYSNRQQMLMMMRAFHIRTITFNRAVGHMASGKHK